MADQVTRVDQTVTSGTAQPVPGVPVEQTTTTSTTTQTTQPAAVTAVPQSVNVNVTSTTDDGTGQPVQVNIPPIAGTSTTIPAGGGTVNINEG